MHLEVTYTITYETTYSHPSIFEIWIPRLNTWNTGPSNETSGQNSTLQRSPNPVFTMNITMIPPMSTIIPMIFTT